MTILSTLKANCPSFEDPVRIHSINNVLQTSNLRVKLNSFVTTHLAEDGKGLGRYRVTKNRSVDRASDVKLPVHENTRRNFETTSEEKLT